jgi:hypothetical protein
MYSLRRFAARPLGLTSGLALAVRPAGLAEVSGSQGRVLKVVLRSGQKRSPGALDAGGASPDNAHRSGPLAVTSSRLPADLARARRPGRGAGGRGSAVTAGAAGVA